MRILIVLCLVGCALAQFNPFLQAAQQFGRQQNFQQNRQRQNFRRPQQQQSNQIRGGGGAVDDRNGNSAYHFSWRHDRSTFSGQGAFRYCSRLGGGWAPVSINDGSESNFVNRVIQGERLEYIWTGASNQGRSWRWADGAPVQRINWSHTGGARRPQPDNREGNEACLAVLNNFYGDGVKWHDVACSHRKPTICERRA